MVNLGMVIPKPYIRRARTEDIDSLAALLEILFGIEEDFIFDAERQRRGLRRILNDERSCVLVAEQEHRVVGMCTGQLIISTAEGGPALLVEDVIVREEYRGRGTGRRLIDALAEWAREQGATRLQLLADCNNAGGLGFYERLGWQTTRLICLRKRSS